MKTANIFRTVGFYCISIGVVLLAAPPLLLLILLPERWRYNKIFLFCLHFLYRGITGALLIPLTVIYEDIIPCQPLLIVANHQSVFDIPLIGTILPLYPHMWLYKYELDAIPILSFFIRRMGIAIGRSSSMDGMRALSCTLKKMKATSCQIIIFPEGGRFTDGILHEFFAGFALLALKTGHPVVPIYLENVGQVCPPGSFFVRYAPVRIVVGSRLNMQPQENMQEFSERVRHWFIEHEEKKRYVR